MTLVRYELIPSSPQKMFTEIACSVDVTWCHQNAGINNLKGQFFLYHNMLACNYFLHSVRLNSGNVIL